jgi:hypothetical protein
MRSGIQISQDVNCAGAKSPGKVDDKPEAHVSDPEKSSTRTDPKGTEEPQQPDRLINFGEVRLLLKLPSFCCVLVDACIACTHVVTLR